MISSRYVLSSHLPKVVEGPSSFPCLPTPTFTDAAASNTAFELGTHIQTPARGRTYYVKLTTVRFNNVGPNNDPLEGNELDIVVTAYATINGKEFKSDPVTETGDRVCWQCGFSLEDGPESTLTGLTILPTTFTHRQRRTLLDTTTTDPHSVVNYLTRTGWWVGDRPDHAHMVLFNGVTIETRDTSWSLGIAELSGTSR